MSIDVVLNAIQSGLRAPDALPLIVRKSEIHMHAGAFSWEELNARNYSAPSVFISASGWQKPAAEPHGYRYPQFVVEARFVAGIVAKSNKSAVARNALARAIAEQLTLVLLREPDWGLADVGTPDPARVSAEGLFIPAADADNQALWQVSWYQPITLDPNGPGWTLEHFAGFDTDHFEPGVDTGTAVPLAQTTANYPE